MGTEDKDKQSGHGKGQYRVGKEDEYEYCRYLL